MLRETHDPQFGSSRVSEGIETFQKGDEGENTKYLNDSAYRSAKKIKGEKLNESKTLESSREINLKEEKLSTYKKKYLTTQRKNEEEKEEISENSSKTSIQQNYSYRDAVRRKDELKTPPVSEPVKARKLTGFTFWIIFVLGTFNEILDIVLNFTVILSFLTFITNPIMAAIMGVYFYINDVKPDKTKVATWILSGVIQIIPFINILPVFPLTLLITRYLENQTIINL